MVLTLGNFFGGEIVLGVREEGRFEEGGRNRGVGLDGVGCYVCEGDSDAEPDCGGWLGEVGRCGGGGGGGGGRKGRGG